MAKLPAAIREAASNPTYTGELKPQMKKVAELVGQGMSWTAAGTHAGYANPKGHIGKWTCDPRMLAIVAQEREKTASVAQIKRQTVVDGLLDAVAMAKLVSDPHALIKAWETLGKLCGFFAPEVKKWDISFTAKRAISQFEQLSDAELLELAEQDLSPKKLLDVSDADIVSETTRDQV